MGMSDFMDTYWMDCGYGPAIQRHLVWLREWEGELNSSVKSGMESLGPQLRKTTELIELLERLSDD